MDFEILESKKIFDGKLLKVWLERVLYPDGRKVELEIVRHPGSVAILPIDDKGQIWFSSQYRHPVRDMLLEIPAGTLEEGEDPKDCAAREIREEIGMGAGTIEQICSFYLAPGYSTEFMTVFLASDLFSAPLDQDYGEYIEIRKIPAEEVYRMLDKGEIKDAKTAAVLGAARGKIFPQ